MSKQSVSGGSEGIPVPMVPVASVLSPSVVSAAASGPASTPSSLAHRQSSSHVVRAAAAAAGSLLTSLLMTPLDVVKTRMQAPGSVLPSSTTRAVFALARAEGVATLWSGLSPTLIMAVPSTSLYFTLYHALKEHIEDVCGGGWHSTILAPLVSGAIARTAVATVSSPLELVRTNMQSVRSGYSVAEGLRRELRSPSGVRSLWRGLGPTLLRDVPFSMVYWMAYEALKTWLLTVPSIPGEGVGVSFVSGALAGSVAAFLTTPFDVAKTRAQAFAEGPAGGVRMPNTTYSILKYIAQHDGYRAVFAGLGPRVGKVAPSCAVMIGTYEGAKSLFKELDP